MSTKDLVALFHHRWAPPALAVLADRGAARFVELQRLLGAGSNPLRQALAALVDLGYAQRNPGYGHPLRPEYLVTPSGRTAGETCARLLRAADPDVLLRKWSVPTLAQLEKPRRFSELRAELTSVSPRALALALQDLEQAGLIERDVLSTRPPSSVYRARGKGRRVARLAAVTGD
jgi:DNA-binding HxlR family transcriptional regulator